MQSAADNRDDSLRQEVARFYQQPTVAQGYVAQRYSGSTGRAVIRRELAIVKSLLPKSGRILDVACGTGRLGSVLGPSYTLVGLDSSEAMLREASATGRYSELVQGDAFSLPFADGSFDAAVALRLLFHFPDPLPILKELARVTKPSGLVVFETAPFSPRSGRAWDSTRWGPKIFVHTRELVQERLDSLGLRPSRTVDAFLFSPYLYRHLPSFGLFLLERLEAVLPSSFRCRSFWQAVRGQAGVDETEQETEDQTEDKTNTEGAEGRSVHETAGKVSAENPYSSPERLPNDTRGESREESEA